MKAARASQADAPIAGARILPPCGAGMEVAFLREIQFHVAVRTIGNPGLAFPQVSAPFERGGHLQITSRINPNDTISFRTRVAGP